MIIDALTMSDFGAFATRHRIELSPRPRANRQAPIVLFGGMNGSGKTTLLAALKLALYGKAVCGPTASQLEYQQYLRQFIHHSPSSLVQPSYASVELEFRYAMLGVVSRYRVKRDWWVERNDKLKEGLVITRDDRDLTQLSYEQAQSFLNELIPMGVSELFFFDGERISHLAEETGGESLKDAINKLLGLDVIERLDADLAVLARTRNTRDASAEKHARLAKLEQERVGLLASIEELKWYRDHCFSLVPG